MTKREKVGEVLFLIAGIAAFCGLALVIMMVFTDIYLPYFLAGCFLLSIFCILIEMILDTIHQLKSK